MIIKNSSKQSEIFLLLAKTRGANAEQITRALNNVITYSKLTQTYELINKLISKKYVQYFIYQDNDKQKRLYYLSKHGLDLFHNYYGISENKIGTGLFGNFGHFKFALYKPKQHQIKHLLMTIDAMIDVYLIKKHTNLQIDFAHNLYAATKYIKPDFVIHVGKDKWYVEIDRMNERGSALNKKFELYNAYFKQLDGNVAQVKGIYFIVPNPKNYKSNQFDSKQQIRYESIVKAYFEACKNYKDKIDLCFLTTEEFPNIFQTDCNLLHKKSELIESIKTTPDKKIEYYENFYYQINPNRKLLAIYFELNINRTKIWYDLLAIQKQYSRKVDTGGTLQYDSYKFIPDVKILTRKKNLKNILQVEEYPVLINPMQSMYRTPEIIFFED